jgi:hypothetical protein
MVGMATGVFDLVETIPDSMAVMVNPIRSRHLLKSVGKGCFYPYLDLTILSAYMFETQDL